MGKACAVLLADSVDALLLADLDGDAVAAAARELSGGHAAVEALRAALGPSVEDPGIAYSWAKRGVQRLVAREASWFGQRGARICSVSPGIISTPQGKQEAAAHSSTAGWSPRSVLPDSCGGMGACGG